MITKIILTVSILFISIGESYFKGPESVNYPAAKSYCELHGTTLASIVAVNEFNEAVSVCGSTNRCFIGLRDDINGNDDMLYEWDDGSDIKSSYGFNSDKSPTTSQGPWRNGEPNEYRQQPEDCVQIQNGEYNDVQCDVRYGFPLCNDAPPPSYFKGPTASGFSNAAGYCESKGTTLASIGTEANWNEAKSICGSDNCWIGLQDDLNGNDDMIWAWDDGIDITKSYGFDTDRKATTSEGPWDFEEPNESGGRQEDCVHMLPNTGKYNDETCDGRRDYFPLCNKAPVQKEYFRGPTRLSYGAASTYCRSQDGKLASIISQNEWNQANSACGSNICWIGLRDDINGNDEGVFAWDDGSRISNSYGFNADNTPTTGQLPWNAGEPNEFQQMQEDCVEMYSNGKYNDDTCDVANYPLCMRDNGSSNVTANLFFWAKSVHEQISYPDHDNNNGYNDGMNDVYHGNENNNYHQQYPDNNDDWMNDAYHRKDNDYYEQYPDNKYNYKQYPDNNNNGMNSIEVSSNMLWIICGLMIINIICLTIYCMDNNKCNHKFNEKQKRYKVVRYESEDTEV